CSPGGHLQQMLALRPAWEEADRSWVTLAGPDVSYLLREERVVLGRGPTNRSLLNLARNLGLAWRLLRRERPEAILSTGAALAVPFFLVGKLLRIRLVYVESVTRTSSLSLTGRLVYRLADRFFVQWPELAEQLRRAEFAGAVL
ncbi:MAG TPA: PssD/Cps14F family polysaccharide biosynthesis glycosyltransferase, partial [Solirubrobacterales bacterium]|nr:PssD/Cps14F family polysaccharide biosynthesis glycosyltransferase [Solirubrobacterales bacterium]